VAVRVVRECERPRERGRTAALTKAGRAAIARRLSS
jgi:hypothetical protein